MEKLEIEKGLSDSIDIAKLAFEMTKGIQTYQQSGREITGKTGARIGSYGEEINVSCHSVDDNKTLLTISGDREVSTNITANPDTYLQRYVNHIYNLGNKYMGEIMWIAQRQLNEFGTKEVRQSSNQASGRWLLYAVLVGIGLIYLLVIGSM